MYIHFRDGSETSAKDAVSCACWAALMLTSILFHRRFAMFSTYLSQRE